MLYTVDIVHESDSWESVYTVKAGRILVSRHMRFIFLIKNQGRLETEKFHIHIIQRSDRNNSYLGYIDRHGLLYTSSLLYCIWLAQPLNHLNN